MFDKNYLGHKLIHFPKYSKKDDYICDVCGVELWYEEVGDDYMMSDSYSYILGEDDTDGECVLNCEEYIIKNIIE